MKNKKIKITLVSIGASLLLTIVKLIIGYLTDSLGILSEALHSGFDLMATIFTFYAIQIAIKPADKDHHFGHGKIENFSALVQSVLLLITCGWIIYDAIHRLRQPLYIVKVNFWSYAVLVLSILVDVWRSHSLLRVAKKYNNAALHADALHFSSDMLSSLVVIMGLIAYQFGFYWADAVAGLSVAIIIFFVASKLSKQAIDILLDKTPEDIHQKIINILNQNKEIAQYHDLKVRRSGEHVFVNVCIHVNPVMSIQHAHDIMDVIEAELKNTIQNCDISIHIEPEGHNKKIF